MLLVNRPIRLQCGGARGFLRTWTLEQTIFIYLTLFFDGHALVFGVERDSVTLYSSRM